MSDQLEELRQRVLQKFGQVQFSTTALSNGGVLISIVGLPLEAGWNRTHANVLFVQPPGYPAAAPDCFWVEPAVFRLANGATPQNSNDGNAIPADTNAGRQTTWFSWHVQAWNPSTDRLDKFFQLILARLHPAR